MEWNRNELGDDDRATRSADGFHLSPAEFQTFR